jgi:hypothetical protein
MKVVAEQPPLSKVSKIAEMLERFGFKIQLLDSKGYV